MKDTFLLGTIFLLLTATSAPLFAADKQEDVRMALQVVQKIYAYGSSHKWAQSSMSDTAITPLVDVLSRPRELEKCAILCMNIAFPGDADEVGFDNYFYSGYHACVNKLSNVRGAEATAALKEIEWSIHADGGEREFLDDAIAYQTKLR